MLPINNVRSSFHNGVPVCRMSRLNALAGDTTLLLSFSYRGTSTVIHSLARRGHVHTYRHAYGNERCSVVCLQSVRHTPNTLKVSGPPHHFFAGDMMT